MLPDMINTASSMEDITSALSSVQEAVRKEIAARIAAGEFIAGSDENGTLITSRPPHCDLAARRQRLVEEHAAKLAALGPMEHKSAV